MIKNIIAHLEIAKTNGIKSELINLALGKNKMPESIKEGFKLLRYKI